MFVGQGGGWCFGPRELGGGFGGRGGWCVDRGLRLWEWWLCFGPRELGCGFGWCEGWFGGRGRGWGLW